MYGHSQRRGRVQHSQMLTLCYEPKRSQLPQQARQSVSPYRHEKYRDLNNVLLESIEPESNIETIICDR